MAEELQNLLEKIKREGVDKANAEAAAILARAELNAEARVKAAEEKAAQLMQAAKVQAEQDAARGAETIRQAARDTLLHVEESVTALFERILVKNVTAALADPAAVLPLATEAIRALVTGDAAAEVVAEGKLAEALRAQLAAQKQITVITDATAQTGFTVRLDGGRVAHDFTGAVLAEALAARLRPALARLLKG